METFVNAPILSAGDLYPGETVHAFRLYSKHAEATEVINTAGVQDSMTRKGVLLPALVQVCDQPHPLLVAQIVRACMVAHLDDAYAGMKVS